MGGALQSPAFLALGVPVWLLWLGCVPSEPVAAVALPLEPESQLHPERLDPALGQTIQVDLAYAGPWPAALSWDGVDQAEGTQAWVTLTSLGETVLRVDGAEVVLDVQPARNRSDLIRLPIGKRPVPDADRACFDPRFPALSGPWIVACEGGKVARALPIQGGEERLLEPAIKSPGIGASGVYGLSRGGWSSQDWGWQAGKPAPLSPVAPLGVGLEQVVVLTADAVVRMPWDAGQRRALPAAPASWYGPAVSEEAVVWVDRRDAAWTGLDVLRLSEDGQSAQVLVRAPGDQAHVAASQQWVAWIEPHFVVVQDLHSGERRRYPSDTHTASGLSLWGPVACWEHWNGEDVDAVCSDGLIADGPGHQRSPSRYQGWMLYRDGERTMVATAVELVWDDDDPRAQRLGARVSGPSAYQGAWVPEGVRYSLPPLEGDWTLEQWQDGAWISLGPYFQDVMATDAVRAVRIP